MAVNTALTAAAAAALDSEEWLTTWDVMSDFFIGVLLGIIPPIGQTAIECGGSHRSCRLTGSADGFG